MQNVVTEIIKAVIVERSPTAKKEMRLVVDIYKDLTMCQAVFEVYYT